MRELWKWLTRNKEGEQFEVLAEYNMGNILAFANEFPELASEMFRKGAILHDRSEDRGRRGDRDPEQHHTVPMVRIVKRGRQHFLMYGQEWHDERDRAATRSTMFADLLPIGGRRAKQIMERFREFDEQGGRPGRRNPRP